MEVGDTGVLEEVEDYSGPHLDRFRNWSGNPPAASRKRSFWDASALNKASHLATVVHCSKACASPAIIVLAVL
jgi:hypothetical protein